jgi:hypothetical protein
LQPLAPRGYRLRLTALAAAAGTALGTVIAVSAASPALAENGPGTPPYWAQSPFSVPSGTGASVPFTEYEAESAATTGHLIGPDFAQGDLATEASGREAAQLTAPGQYVQFTLTSAANALDVHYALNQGASGTLSVYVNGAKQSKELSLTSAYSYISTGGILGSTTHKFYDEARMMFGSTLAAGTTVRLEVDSADTAAPYTIDVADFYNVAAAAPQPANSIAVTSEGADSTGASDSTSAFRTAISAASAAGESVWIPPGTYLVTSALQVNSNGSLGSGFTVNGLWIQDTNVGFWLQFGNSNCTVENNVIESTDADGLNFNGNATSCTGNSVTGLASAGTAYASDSSGFTAMLSGNSWQNGAAEGPYGGTASAVPGTVQAVSYDTGGQGAGYNVTSVNGTGNGYRSDGVDIEACTDTGCGDDLGWTAPGQWFRYTVNVAAAGAYTVSFRVAAPSAVTDAFHLTDARGDDLSDAETLPATGGWQGWTTVTDTIPLPAGRQTLIVDQDNPGWNLRYLSFAAGGSGGGSALSASPSSASFGSVTVGSASAAQTVTVSNPNSSAVSVSSASVSGPFSQASTCGTSIAANGSCTVSVTFAPTAAGPATGSLAVASSAPGSPLTVALSGTGTSANTNLALGQPTSASGYTQAYVPANAVDGNASSYWESTDNVWV